MKLPHNLGMLLLAIYLIVVGATAFITVTFINIGLVSAILAIAAGILLLLGK